ncbi:hypothetical protein [Paraburkholderia sp.]|uniref:glucuronyl esterase domain-containing protein n=1 Tax=Paraburkholderia sp. TaxID=1926495 RepID=UPI0039E5DCCE
MENELSLALPSLWGDKDRPHTAREWEYARKPELIELYSSQVYGRTPEGGGVTGIEVMSRNGRALNGLATMTQLRITLSGPRKSKTAVLLLYTPNSATASSPAPVFVGLNFMGNHSTTSDPTIEVIPGFASAAGWETAAAERAAQARRWPVGIALERGYAVATMHCADLEEDGPGLAAGGVRGLFNSEAELASPTPDMWGAIGAWAWGLSRILDVLATIPEIDATAAIVHGHSRLGKTALWAAAQDPRFAAAISNNSGCVGASLFRHASGETISMITETFPHWFAKNLNAYADDLEALPVDQHHLLALIAPRPVHVSSATLDAHADPRGEFLSTVYASPVMELYGYHGTLPRDKAQAGSDVSWQTAVELPTPEPGSRVGERLSFHMREGVHDVLAEDWRHFADFADANVLS